MDYVTADHHFFHKNIIKFTDRPYSFDEDGVDDMNMSMAGAIAELKEDDTLYHLGDLYFGGKEKGLQVANFLSWSPCSKVLVIGNHDNLKSWPTEVIDCFDQILDAKIIRRHKTDIFMSHRPLMIDKYWKGDIINLHGHVHGIIPNPPGRLDVGVDPALVYYGVPRPFTMDEAIALALDDKPATHAVGSSLP